MTVTLPESTIELISHTNNNAVMALDHLTTFNKIITDEDYQASIDLLKQIKQMMHELEDARTSITKPINENLREINAQFTEPSSRLQMVERRLKALTANYVTEKRAEQQRMVAEAAAELARSQGAGAGQSAPEATDKYVATVQQAATASAPVVSGVSFSEKWDWSVTDLALVPREYLCIDTAKVNAAVKSGTRQIPGLNIFPTTQTRVVAGK